MRNYRVIPKSNDDIGSSGWYRFAELCQQGERVVFENDHFFAMSKSMSKDWVKNTLEDFERQFFQRGIYELSDVNFVDIYDEVKEFVRIVAEQKCASDRIASKSKEKHGKTDGL